VPPVAVHQGKATLQKDVDGVTGKAQDAECSEGAT